MTTSLSNQAVRNTFQLLELLSGAPDGMRLTRLVEISGQPKTTVHRLLTTLAELNIVCHDEDRYHLNAHWQRFGGDQFTAPILGADGSQLAGLTLRTRGPVACEITANRLRRLVADLAVAVSRRIGVPGAATRSPAQPRGKVIAAGHPVHGQS